MPQKIKPKNVTYVTGKDGEVKLQIEHQIDLNLTINLDSLGGIKVNVDGNITSKEKEEDEVEWEIPDFGSHSIENFGK